MAVAIKRTLTKREPLTNGIRGYEDNVCLRDSMLLRESMLCRRISAVRSTGMKFWAMVQADV